MAYLVNSALYQQNYYDYAHIAAYGIQYAYELIKAEQAARPCDDGKQCGDSSSAAVEGRNAAFAICQYRNYCGEGCAEHAKQERNGADVSKPWVNALGYCQHGQLCFGSFRVHGHGGEYRGGDNAKNNTA